jgi:hypothetical protein
VVPDPISQSPAPPGSHSFHKGSPAVAGLSSSDPAGSDIAFSWHDYFDTNEATSSLGELGQQSAKAYRIQVDNEPSFAQPLLDEAVVDQATYTSAIGSTPKAPSSGVSRPSTRRTTT